MRHKKHTPWLRDHPAEAYLRGTSDTRQRMSNAPSSPPVFSRLLATLVLGGAATCGGYVALLPRVYPKQTSLSPLWFGIDGGWRHVYYVSILCAAVAFCLVIGWLLARAAQSSHVHAASLQATIPPWIVFFVGGTLWSVALYGWGRSGESLPAAMAVVGALCLTTGGAAWLLAVLVRRVSAPRWVLAMAAVALFHVAVLDNVGWGARFLQHSLRTRTRA